MLILVFRVLNSKNEEIELLSSIECKGIVGNDQRHYILDLLRTFPPDVNYLPGECFASVFDSCHITPPAQYLLHITEVLTGNIWYFTG